MRAFAPVATVTTHASRRSSRMSGVGEARMASRVPSGDHSGAPRTVNAPLVSLEAVRVATSITHTWASRSSPSKGFASSRRRVRASASRERESVVR